LSSRSQNDRRVQENWYSNARRCRDSKHEAGPEGSSKIQAAQDSVAGGFSAEAVGVVGHV
ncbi:hypothetical protein K474DRAFT_1666459, partial [Panus rudis PR-1116 ss-1]